MPETTAPIPFEAWALVEIMGHVRIAGKVTEQVIAGASFLRVDVPAGDQQPAFTKFYGAGSIYSITPVDEATAHHAAQAWRVRPVDTYILPGLPAPRGPLPEDEEGGDDGGDYGDDEDADFDDEGDDDDDREPGF